MKLAVLLANYSLSQILLFLVVFSIALKGVVTFWDWAIERLRKIFKKESQEENDSKKIELLANRQDNFENTLKEINEKIDLLIQSDKDDIKSYITREHHYYCYQKKWIDDYTLDCIERRYNHYKEEGGNSFIEGLMKEIRSLQKFPPT